MERLREKKRSIDIYDYGGFDLRLSTLPFKIYKNKLEGALQTPYKLIMILVILPIKSFTYIFL